MGQLQYACGDSTGCKTMMVLAAVLGALAGLCWLVVTIQAFRKRTAQGVLCLLIPPYALYYAVAKLEHRRRGMLAAGMAVSFILAAVAWNSATAVFGPNVAAVQPDFDKPFPDEPQAGSDAKQAPGPNDDLGNFDKPLDQVTGGKTAK